VEGAEPSVADDDVTNAVGRLQVYSDNEDDNDDDNDDADEVFAGLEDGLDSGTSLDDASANAGDVSSLGQASMSPQSEWRSPLTGSSDDVYGHRVRENSLRSVSGTSSAPLPARSEDSAETPHSLQFPRVFAQTSFNRDGDTTSVKEDDEDDSYSEMSQAEEEGDEGDEGEAEGLGGASGAVGHPRGVEADDNEIKFRVSLASFNKSVENADADNNKPKRKRTLSAGSVSGVGGVGSQSSWPSYIDPVTLEFKNIPASAKRIYSAPHLDYSNHGFQVRGRTYLQDSIKVNPGLPMCKMMLLEMYEVQAKVSTPLIS
jgi:hypothetical protein